MTEFVCDTLADVPEVRAVLLSVEGSWLTYLVAVEPWTRAARGSVVETRLIIRDEFPHLNIYFESVPAATLESPPPGAQVVLLKESRA